MRVAIPAGQRIFGIDRVIESRTKSKSPGRYHDVFIKIDNISRGIENNRRNYRVFITLVLTHVKEKRRFLFPDRTVDKAAEITPLACGTVGREWISGVQDRVIEIEIPAPVIFVEPRPR